MAKALTLRQHVAKMTDVCGPIYAPIVGLICLMAARPGTSASKTLNYSALMPDDRLGMPTCPFHSSETLKIGYVHPHG